MVYRTSHVSASTGPSGSLSSVIRRSWSGSFASWCGAALSSQNVGELHSDKYPIRHLENLIRLAGMLKSLPAQLEDHEYSYTSFGSWWANVRFRGILFRIVFDGRDREFVIERSATDRRPYAWGSPE